MAGVTSVTTRVARHPDGVAQSGEIGGSSHDHDGDVTHRLVPDSPVEGTTATGNRAAPGEAVRAASFSALDLRRAVVLREVLAPPVSLRGDRDGV